jgi:hypothetical protein
MPSRGVAEFHTIAFFAGVALIAGKMFGSDSFAGTAAAPSEAA